MPANYSTAAQNDEMYGDGAAPGGAEPSEEQEEKTEYPEQVINSAVCPGMKAGDTLEVRVVAVRDGEYVVQYEPEDEGREEREESPPPREPAAAPPGGEMASMME